ncbi:MAG: hypothetical protein IPL40_10425 [Proteobacteria bacterium]|nr:hypothetical protein [Pseudomonadota bacterium]
MQVACPQCRAHLVLDGAEPQAGVQGLTCARCGFAFAVNVVAAVAANAPTAPGLPAAGRLPALVPTLASAPKTSFQAEQAAGVIGAPGTSVHRIDTTSSVVVDPLLQEEQAASSGLEPSEQPVGAGGGSWRRAAMEAVTQEIRVPEALAQLPTVQASAPGEVSAAALVTTPTQTDPTLQAVGKGAEALAPLVTEPESGGPEQQALGGPSQDDAGGVPLAVLAALGATAPRGGQGAARPWLRERATAPDHPGVVPVATPPLLTSASGPGRLGPPEGCYSDPEFDLAMGIETDATAELRPEWRREAPRGLRPFGAAMLLLGLAAAALALFVLARNDWTLDVGRFGRMLTRAFGSEEPANPLLAELRLTGPATEVAALADQPRVLLVRGTVENGSPVARGFVYVRAWIERGGVIVASAEAPLDNVFTVAELSRLSARGLRGAINPAGRERRNARLGPGEVVPYMVVLTPLPPGLAAAEEQSVRVAISRVEPFEARPGAR